MDTYQSNDNSVVVVIGSGAGGGTLANELCQKGIKVVLLEAGKRESPESFVNDEWGSFGQLAWLDKRTTSGSWQVAKDVSGLPAWICKTVGGASTHWAGPTGRVPRTPLPRHGRAACQQLGFCFQGCKTGAKWSSLYTEVPAAEKTGRLELRTECHAARIEHDDKGKVTGVVYFDKDKKEQRQKARAVCVAGNSIETPRLLLLSKSNKFPDGLANSSGQVGRNYQRHTTGSVYATFDQPVRMWRGTTMAGIVTDEARNDPKRGFIGGFRAEEAPGGFPLLLPFPHAGAGGPAVTPGPDNYAHHAGRSNVFISDGSQFTTGAAENPTLTIVTLAIRQAEYIAKQMSAKAI